MPVNPSSQLLSSEITEFIGKKPHWILSYGNAIFLFLLISVICSLWSIQFPEIISVPVKINITTNFNGHTQYFGSMIIKKSDIGKIAIDQQVRIKLPSNSDQYGNYVNAKISFISHDLQGDGYLVKAYIFNMTNLARGLTAQAEIIIKNTRLLERFYLICSNRQHNK
jgi:hypothetical protein